MLYPMIPKADAHGIIQHYSRLFAKASNQEKLEVWQSCIHDFRFGAYLWHAEPDDLIGKTVWWLVPKRTYRANWHEVYQGKVVGVHKGSMFDIQAGKNTVHVRLNRIVAFENEKPSK